MLTYTHRPKSFREVKGQDLPKKVLMNIAANPERAPRAIILGGGRGLGKTTTARIFGRAVNCESRDGDCCNKCATCKSIMEGGPLYIELDSAIVGNVETMKDLRGTFAYSVQNGYRVVVLDEVHLCSKSSQASLLTVLEEAPKGVFFIMATTNKELLLPTIISRSLELSYENLTDLQLVDLLRSIAVREEIQVSDKALGYMARRVKGHARDGIQQLEKLRLLGEEDYLKEIKLLDVAFEELLATYAARKMDQAQKVLAEITSNPVLHIEQDFEFFVRRLADAVFMEGKQDKKARDITMFYLRNHKFLKTTNDWFIFLSALASLFEERETPKTVGRFSKA